MEKACRITAMFLHGHGRLRRSLPESAGAIHGREYEGPPDDRRRRRRVGPAFGSRRTMPWNDPASRERSESAPRRSDTNSSSERPRVPGPGTNCFPAGPARTGPSGLMGSRATARREARAPPCFFGRLDHPGPVGAGSGTGRRAISFLAALPEPPPPDARRPSSIPGRAPDSRSRRGQTRRPRRESANRRTGTMDSAYFAVEARPRRYHAHPEDWSPAGSRWLETAAGSRRGSARRWRLERSRTRKRWRCCTGRDGLFGIGI